MESGKQVPTFNQRIIAKLNMLLTSPYVFSHEKEEVRNLISSIERPQAMFGLGRWISEEFCQRLIWLGDRNHGLSQNDANNLSIAPVCMAPSAPPVEDTVAEVHKADPFLSARAQAVLVELSGNYIPHYKIAASVFGLLERAGLAEEYKADRVRLVRITDKGLAFVKERNL